ncbi:MAG: glycosyltransferase family 39 protein [Pirellulales bacterium]|nr:glycosyltransferase family 39 protein [Pirellulales bacterium]
MNGGAAIPSNATDGRDRAVLAFWLLLAGFVAAWTIVPALCQPNLPIDSIEMAHWGREWELGYYKHPPLPAWVAQLTVLAFGEAAWGVYLVAELAAAVGFWAVWRLARELVPPWQALCATAVLQGCYHFNWSTPDINNNTITRPFWAVAVLMMYWALTRKQLRYWIGYGAARGVGLWSKYDMLCLGAGMTWLLTWNREARGAWRTSGPYAAAGVILSIVAPHGAWLVQHDFAPLFYATGRAADGAGWGDRVINPIVFWAKQAPVALPILGLAVPLVGLRWRRRALAEDERLPRDLLIAACLAPAAAVLVLGVATGARLRTGWTAQFWCYLGLLAIYCFELKADVARATRQTLRWCGAAVAASLLVVPLHHFAGPLMRGKASRIHFPGDALAEAADRAWREVSPAPLPVAASRDWWSAANVSFYGGSRCSTLSLEAPSRTPWYSEAELARSGGVLIEPLDGDDRPVSEIVRDWRARFGRAAKARIVTLPHEAVGAVAPARFVIAALPPASAAPAVRTAVVPKNGAGGVLRR